MSTSLHVYEQARLPYLVMVAINKYKLNKHNDCYCDHTSMTSKTVTCTLILTASFSQSVRVDPAQGIRLHRCIDVSIWRRGPPEDGKGDDTSPILSFVKAAGSCRKHHCHLPVTLQHRRPAYRAPTKIDRLQPWLRQQTGREGQQTPEVQDRGVHSAELPACLGRHHQSAPMHTTQTT